jgi:aspartyl protease family protein
MNDPTEAHGQKRMGSVMQFMAWAVFMGLGIFYFADILDRQNNPNQSVEFRETPDGQLEVLLERNKWGHYVTSGFINAEPVTFLLDTGATGVAIPGGVANRLGLRKGAAFKTQTANGASISYAVTLSSVSVGGISLQNVPAGIAAGLETDEVLLGMSFLKHIEFSQRGNTLILRQ